MQFQFGRLDCYTADTALSIVLGYFLATKRHVSSSVSGRRRTKNEWAQSRRCFAISGRRNPDTVMAKWADDKMCAGMRGRGFTGGHPFKTAKERWALSRFEISQVLGDQRRQFRGGRFAGPGILSFIPDWL